MTSVKIPLRITGVVVIACICILSAVFLSYDEEAGLLLQEAYMSNTQLAHSTNLSLRSYTDNRPTESGTLSEGAGEVPDNETAVPGISTGSDYVMPPANATAEGQAILNECAKHEGKPYVYDTAGPNTFDCSGFVCYVMNHSGIYNIGRTSASTYGSPAYSTEVPYDQAQPGDIICFQHTSDHTTADITHIGIYAGNNMMWHASSTHGIVYASCRTNYYIQHFHSTRRINESYKR